MIQYLSATIDGRAYYFERQSDGSWRMVASAPNSANVYDVTLQLETLSGQTFLFTPEEWGDLLRLVVTPDSRDVWLMGYLPRMFHETLELLAIFKPQEDELRSAYGALKWALEDNFIMSASESRIRQLERALGIIPSGELIERKRFLLSVMRKSISNKLNESVIKNVVKALTGGDAVVTFGNSTVTVKILPPQYDYIIDLNAVSRALQPRIPAHLGLNVVRYYATWADIKNFYASWEALKDALPDWQAVSDTVYG